MWHQTRFVISKTDHTSEHLHDIQAYNTPHSLQTHTEEKKNQSPIQSLHTLSQIDTFQDLRSGKNETMFIHPAYAM